MSSDILASIASVLGFLNMSYFRILLVIVYLFIFPIDFVLGASSCLSFSECNEQGGQAYKKQDYQVAIALYEWQLRYAEMRKADSAQDEELALNNLIVTNLKYGDNAKARAWMWVALDRGFDSKATRYNIDKVVGIFDYQSMPSVPGHYARYAGMGEWETLDVEPNEQGVDIAIFSLMRIGNPGTLMDSGPAAIGGLSVRLDGKGPYRSAASEDLEKDCSLQILQEGVDISVIESFRDGCQNYGGIGVHAAGIWRKISQIVMNKKTGTCVKVRDGKNGTGSAHGLICMKFGYQQRNAAQKQGVELGEPYTATLARLTKNGWTVDSKWLSTESNDEVGVNKLPICGQGWDAVCHVVMEKGGANLQLTFSGTNDGLPLIGVD